MKHLSYNNLIKFNIILAIMGLFLAFNSSYLSAQVGSWTNGSITTNGTDNNWVSVTTDASGNFHGAWRPASGTSGSISIGSWNGNSWTIVSSFNTSSDSPNIFASILDEVSVAVDGIGDFHVAFRATRGSGSGTTTFGIFYAKYDVSANSWSFEEVQSGTHSGNNIDFDDVAIDVDSTNQPHMAFHFTISDGTISPPRPHNIRYASRATGSWVINDNIDATNCSTGDCFDLFNFGFVLDSNDKAHIVYGKERGDIFDADLMYATNVTSSFVTSVLKDVGDGDSSGVGTVDADIELDSSNNVHISASLADVVGFSVTASVSHFTNASGSFVEATAVSAGNHGSPSTIGVNGAADKKVIAYRDADPISIRAATQEGTAAWMDELVWSNSNDGIGTGNFLDAIMNNSGQIMILFHREVTSNDRRVEFAFGSLGAQPDTDGDGVLDVNDNCPDIPNADQANNDGDSLGDVCDPDDDNDTILDGVDNCPLTANADQANNDGDSLGDVCDPDDDNDTILDGVDNCPLTANADQANNDGDSLGDVCDPDDDNDTILDGVDNCPLTANADQANNDGDGLGDVCDPDDDNDTILDGADNCPFTANTDQADFDGDNIGDVCDGDRDGDGVLNVDDNCPDNPNLDQADNDGDGSGDACDPDDDNDGVADGDDNCPFTANADQSDLDGDNIGDVCDIDIDGDGVNNDVDNCPLAANTDQTNTDGDTEGDACDADDDNDGVADGDDNCPLVDNADQANNDGDGLGDVCDPDDDNDGVADGDDNCPLTANTTQADNDGDGPGDACDPDDDNDGVADGDDNCQFVPNPGQVDTDNDGNGDACDTDSDGDGVLNEDDNCPDNPNPAQEDMDGDGIGDACDPDIDGDGVNNDVDNCPTTANANQADNDNDGLGDVCDPDDDNDGVADGDDNCPLIANTTQDDFDGDGLGDVCDDDRDGDGVLNSSDVCAFTPLGEIVDPANGCSIDQLNPCEGPRGTTEEWKNHGKYVSSVAKSANSFLEQGLITEEEKDEIMSNAASSSCGK